MQLVEEATEGCWIGHRARMFTSEIGSVYSPPKQSKMQPAASKHVETVIDIAHNEGVRVPHGLCYVFFSLTIHFYRDGYLNAKKVA